MKVPPAYAALYPYHSEEKVSGFFREDVQTLQAIINEGRLAPVFKSHRSHCAGCPEGAIFQIPYREVMDGRFVICVNTDGLNSFWSPEDPTVLKEYPSAEALIGDGWLLD